MLHVPLQRFRWLADSALLLTATVVSTLPLGAHAESPAALSFAAVRQSAPSQDTDRQQELLDAERAIVEGLSSRALTGTDVDTSPKDIAANEAAPKQVEPAQPPAKAAVAKAQTQTPPAAAMKQEIAVTQPVIQPVIQPTTTPKPRAQAPAITKLAAENEDLKRDLSSKSERIIALERELEITRGQLASAETELSRISSMGDARARGNFAKLASAHSQTAQPAASAVANRVPRGTGDSEPLPAADLQIATVAVVKAELRLGPGRNHSALMEVARGTRLAVEARQGEWYRVFAPNGQRAWISSDMVTFGGAARNAPDASTVRVKGFSSSIEDEAFKRIQSMTADR